MTNTANSKKCQDMIYLRKVSTEERQLKSRSQEKAIQKKVLNSKTYEELIWIALHIPVKIDLISNKLKKIQWRKNLNLE